MKPTFQESGRDKTKNEDPEKKENTWHDRSDEGFKWKSNLLRKWGRIPQLIFSIIKTLSTIREMGIDEKLKSNPVFLREYALNYYENKISTSRIFFEALKMKRGCTSAKNDRNENYRSGSR